MLAWPQRRADRSGGQSTQPGGSETAERPPQRKRRTKIGAIGVARRTSRWHSQALAPTDARCGRVMPGSQIVQETAPSLRSLHLRTGAVDTARNAHERLELRRAHLFRRACAASLPRNNTGTPNTQRANVAAVAILATARAGRLTDLALRALAAETPRRCGACVCERVFETLRAPQCVRKARTSNGAKRPGEAPPLHNEHNGAIL